MAKKARELGLTEETWVYPIPSWTRNLVDSDHVITCP